VVNVDNKELAEWIRDNLEFDQLILEFYREGEPDSGWIHVSWNSDHNRNQTLKAIKNEDGKTSVSTMVEGKIFSEYIYEYHLNDIDCDKILEQLKKEKYQDFNNSELDSVINSTSSIEVDLLDKFPDLKSHVINCTKEIFNKNTYTNNFKICNSWATKTLSGGFSSKHNHSHSFFSGVFYPMSGCRIRFFKPNMPTFWSLKVENYNEYNMLTCVSEEMKPGTLIIFSSHIEHQIMKNDKDYDRYSIAFNIVPTGQLGVPTQRLVISED
jgi:uncharacterized protein (TIGR02466 family)